MGYQGSTAAQGADSNRFLWRPRQGSAGFPGALGRQKKPPGMRPPGGEMGFWNPVRSVRFHVLGQVVLDAYFLDAMELRLQPIEGFL